MCNLTDHGIGVYLLASGPGLFSGSKSSDAMVSLMDLVPTVYALVGLPIPDRVQGRSLLPLVYGEVQQIHDMLFAEINFHATYEPIRCVRTERFKYIRRYDERTTLVLPNVDDSPSKEFLLSHGWSEQPREQTMFFDLFLDPQETNNIVDHAENAAIQAELDEYLISWMQGTEDPLLSGSVGAPSGVQVNDPDGASPEDPTYLIP